MSAYLHQLQKALQFIEANRHEKITAGQIARHAGISPWYFQRPFSAAVGQPLMEYVKRRQLVAAMEQLRSTRRPIIDIALDAGFNSQEAFTRAFKAMFEQTPGRARTSKSLPASVQFIPNLTPDYIHHLYRDLTMTPTIVTLPSRLVVGLGRPFISALSPKHDNHIVIPGIWSDFIPLMNHIPDRSNSDCLGCVFCDDRESRCFYLACVEVSRADALPAPLEARQIPGGRHAVFTHRGPVDNIGHTMGYIYGAWLPGSGHKLRQAPEIEVYDDRFDPASPNSEMSICIPIE